jgi:hypothetical protein
MIYSDSHAVMPGQRHPWLDPVAIVLVGEVNDILEAETRERDVARVIGHNCESSSECD